MYTGTTFFMSTWRNRLWLIQHLLKVAWVIDNTLLMQHKEEGCTCCLDIKASRELGTRHPSPERSCTNRCETELWTSCRSWWRAPFPDCSAAGYVGFPPLAGTTRREHQRQPSHTPWGEEEEEAVEYEAWETSREDGASCYADARYSQSTVLHGRRHVFIFQNVSRNLWCSLCGLFPSEQVQLTVSVRVELIWFTANCGSPGPQLNKMSSWCEWAEHISNLLDWERWRENVRLLNIMELYRNNKRKCILL